MYKENVMESLLEQYGYDASEVRERVEQVWYEIFEGPDRFYWQTDEGLGYVKDTGNDDVRTEGMSYAMMLAVQFDRKDVFDRLWGWVMRYMYMTEGHHAHYFAWSVDPSGVPNADGPAPDGEEYFAMDLFLAARRWGNGEGIYDYAAWGREILRYCVHKGERYEKANPCGIQTTNSSNSFPKPNGATPPTICRTSTTFSPKKRMRKIVPSGVRLRRQAAIIWPSHAMPKPA